MGLHGSLSPLERAGWFCAARQDAACCTDPPGERGPLPSLPESRAGPHRWPPAKFKPLTSALAPGGLAQASEGGGGGGVEAVERLGVCVLLECSSLQCVVLAGSELVQGGLQSLSRAAAGGEKGK